MSRRRFTKEFKKSATDLVIQDGLSVQQAAQDLGVKESTLSTWVKLRRDADSGSKSLNEDEFSELKRLRKEVRVLRIERNILKKTTVLFAKDTQKGANS